MKKHRFYITSQKERIPDVGMRLVLSREDSHHLRHVLRIGKGDSIDLFDGEGRVSASPASWILLRSRLNYQAPRPGVMKRHFYRIGIVPYLVSNWRFLF
jgi:hypothetical protein